MNDDRNRGIEPGMVFEERGRELTVRTLSDEDEPKVYFTNGKVLLAYDVRRRLTKVPAPTK